MTVRLVSPSFPHGLPAMKTEAQARAEQFICPRCKRPLSDADEAEGCEDFNCPNQGGCK